MASATQGYFPATPCPKWNISESSYFPTRWAVTTVALGALYQFVPQNYKTIPLVALPVIGLLVLRNTVVAFNKDVTTGQNEAFLKESMITSCKTLSDRKSVV